MQQPEPVKKILHTVNKSPFERNSLDSCLRFVHQGHSLLLFEDGIYAALKGTNVEREITKALKIIKIYVLTQDVEARGMQTGHLIDGIQSVDYAGFVDLVVENNTTQAWL